MPTFTKIQAIEPGKVYECSTGKHAGWRVRVTRAGGVYILADPVRNNPSWNDTVRRNGGYSYRREQFERDWLLAQDQHVEEPQEIQEQQEAQTVEEPQLVAEAQVEALVAEPTSAPAETAPVLDAPFVEPSLEARPAVQLRTCIRCARMKAVDEFGYAPKARADGTRSLQEVCKACREVKRKETIRTKATSQRQEANPTRAAPQMPPFVSSTAPATTSSAPDVAELVVQLLDLAKDVERLGTPRALVDLVLAVRDVYLEAEEAHGVFIVPLEPYKRMVAVWERSKVGIDWQRAPGPVE